MKKQTVRKLLLFFLVLAIAAYVLLPYALRYGLERVLRDQGYDQVTVDAVETEPFAGELRLLGISAQKGDGPVLKLQEAYTNLDWMALFRRQGHLQGLAVSGLQLTLQQTADGQLILSGLPLPAAEPDTDDQPSNWGFGIDRLSVTDSELQLRLPGIARTLTVTELLLTGLRNWEPDNPALLQLDARVDQARVRIDGDLRPFAEAPLVNTRLRIDGLDLAQLSRDLRPQLPENMQLSRGQLHADLQLRAGMQEGQPQVSPQGRLSLRDLALQLDGQPQSLTKADWQGSLSWDQRTGLRSDNKLTLEGLSAQLDTRTLQLGSLNLQGKLNWSSAKGLDSDSQLSLAELAAKLDGREVQLAGLNWQGKAGWSADQGPSAAGTLSASQLTATQPAQQLLLAQLKQLELRSLQLGEQLTLTLDGLQIDDIIALQVQDKAAPATLLKAQQLQIGSSRIQIGDSIALGEITLRDARIDIERDAKGKLPVIERLQAGDQADTGKADKSAAPRFTLGGLQLHGASRIRFVDRSVEPSFEQALDVEKLTIGAADSSAPQTWTPVSLSGRLSEYSRLELSGKARPFADKINLDLSGTLKAIELPPLSSYTAGVLGYNLRSGQLDSDIAIKISDDKLDGKAKLVLNKLTVKPADKARLDQLTTKLSMPLDHALNLLRDSNNDIRISLPVGGDIDKPSFDLSDIINTAMANAVKTAAISYIKNVMQPYGALITLVQYADKASTRMALQAVDFPPGSAEVPAGTTPYLAKVDKLLGERPALRINICGFATSSDRTALSPPPPKTGGSEGTQAQAPAPQPSPVSDDVLRALAKSRADNLKRKLVDLKISPDRLFTCNPEIDPAADAKPRAELLL